MKRYLSLLMALVMILSLGGVGQNGTGAIISHAQDLRDGYTLTPTVRDMNMADPSGAFLLTSSRDASAEEVQSLLKISPDAAFTVSASEEGFLIQPMAPLLRNALYTFTIGEASWVFQTAPLLKVMGSLPADQSTEVPVDSGIEFAFSLPVEDISENFSIEPEVKGSFEVHGNTVVFVPDALEPQTVYTVTLKGGLTPEGSKQSIANDYIFRFETAAGDSGLYTQPKGYFAFNNLLSDFAADETPRIPMNYYVYDPQNTSKIQASVYAYDTVELFSKALTDYTQMPTWANYAQEDLYVKHEGLTERMHFEQPLNLDNAYGSQFLELPDKLAPGFYLIDCFWEDLHFQTFIQVTDLSYYFIEAKDSNMIWVNDLKTDKGAAATVTDLRSGEAATANAEGIARLPQLGDENIYMLYKIEYGTKSAVALLGSYMPYKGYPAENEDMYWHYLQTDRPLYKPDDQVSMWGFLKPRYDEAMPQKVTVELDNGGWLYYDYILPIDQDQMAIETQEIDVENGFFETSFDLPNLEPGSYRITVKSGEETVSSTYISVEDYVKPAYKIELNSDKKAVFVNEPILFTAKTSFYEGTPVSKLDVNYNISGFDYKTGQATGDAKGESSFEYVPGPMTDYQGMSYLYASVSASLPESGEIYEDAYVQVFYNDTDVQINGSMKDNIGTLEVQAHKIDISRLNDGTAKDEMDYLGAPIQGQVIKGTLYQNLWKTREVGQTYDFINKVVVPQYEYYTEQVPVREITLTTDAAGQGQLTVPFDENESGYYTAELYTYDQEGRKMVYSTYFSDNWYYSSGEGDYYVLTGDKETYEVGESMTVQMMHNDKPMDSGRYLFVTAQNGIMDYSISKTSTYKSDFTPEMVPNVEISAVYFNGSTYISGGAFTPSLNTENHKILLDVTTDLDSYNPQEIVTMTIQAKIYSQEAGDYVGAPGVTLNIAVVDEALFTLNEQYVDTLSALYSWVPSGIYFTYASHRNDGYNGIMPLSSARNGGMGGMATATSESAMDAVATTGEKSTSATIRSQFKDTAFFDTMHLDSNGFGKYSFQLPDNLTSWRVTMAGISTELNAGSDKKEIIVTMPYFISTNLNTTYLAGDAPYVGVTSYGSELNADEPIHYIATIKESGYTVEVDGKAFDRINLPLQTLKAGLYHITVTGTTASGLTDSVSYPVKVLKTYHETWATDYYPLSSGLTLSTTDQGTTDLMLMDLGRARLLPELYNLAYAFGNRVDQKFVANQAMAILKEVYGIDTGNAVPFNISDYKNADGGIGLLPYAASDLATTVQMMLLEKDGLDQVALKTYLYGLLQDGASDQSLVLLGLALLKEPILGQLDAAYGSNSLDAADYIRLGLAYNALGDGYKAAEIFNANVKPLIKDYDTTARLAGKSTDEMLELSAWAMLLASGTDQTLSDKLYDYVTREYSKEILVSVFKMAYINDRLTHLSDEPVTMTYHYNGSSYTKEAESGWPATISIPSQKLADFKVTEYTGNGALAAVYKKPLTAKISNDDGMSLERHYLDYESGKEMNSFGSSAIVKVEIDWSLSENAVDHSYTVTDYVPSGLAPIDNPYALGLDTENVSWYRDIDGQKVTFYISRDDQEKKPLYYYARVITPGSYKAEAPIMQGIYVKDSLYMGRESKMTID